MNATSTCPGPASLQEYLLGRMSEATAAAVEAHLALCPECRRLLPTIQAEDDFTADFRAQARQPQPANALLDRLAGDVRGRLLRDLPTSQDATPASDGEATPAPTGPASEDAEDLHSLLAPPREPDELGRLGDYRVLKVLGSGGMGVVFLAEDMRLRRRVALKAMKPALAVNARARQRFLREAQLMASLHHDHVVAIHQVGDEKGVPFLAMPLLQGESLDERLKREGRLPTAEVLRIGLEAAEGLAAAHERGLIHRDVKPANLWLEAMPSGRSRVKVLDFGLARAGDGDAQLTQSGVIVGTPAYMAPEQARAETVDARSDLFSLGCVLYKLCTGKTPFAGDTTMALLTALALHTPRPVRDLSPEVPAELSDLVMRMLAKAPTDRPQSAGEVIHAIQAIQRTQTGEGRPSTQPAPSAIATAVPAADLSATAAYPASPRTATAQGAGRGRRWLVAAVLAGFAVAAAVAAVVVIRFKDKDGNPQEIKVELPQGAHDPEVVLSPKDSSPPLAQGDPLSPLALVRKPAKIPGVESWSIESIGPRGRVRCLLSPDGNQVASFSDDGGIRVWNTGDGKLVRVLLGQEHGGALAWSPDGQRVASQASEGNMQIWNIVTGRIIHSVRTGGNCIAWSPDAKTLATDGNDSVYQLWDANTGEKVDVVRPSEGGFTGMLWSPSGKILAVTTETAGGRKVGIWDTANGRKLLSLDAGGELTWSHHGKVLAVFQDSKLKLFDVATGALVRAIDTSQDPCGHGYACFARDDKTVLLGNSEWDLASGKQVRALQSEQLLRLLPPDEKMQESWSWSADAHYFAGDNNGWKVWDASTGKVVFRLPEGVGGGYDSWDFSPDGKSLAQLRGEVFRVWDLPTGRATVVAGSIQNACTVKWSPDGKHLIVGVNGTSTLFDTKSWQSHECTPGSLMYSLTWVSPVWSMDGKTFVGRRGDSLQVCDVELDNPGHILPADATPGLTGVCLSPDGKWMALTRSGQRFVEIWDVIIGKKARALESEEGGYCAWSPDGAYLAVEERGPHHQICIWDLPAGKRVHVLECPEGWGGYFWLAWSADGATVFFCNEHGTARRWDYRTSTEVRTIGTSTGGVYSADWKQSFATPSPAAGTLWDVDRNRELAVLLALPREQSIAISPEGHYRGSPRADQLIVYVVQTAKGQEVLTPKEFADKYGWKNDPDKMQLTDK